MREFVLRREQWLRQPIDKVFAFFADAGNLEAITPVWLGFHILTPAPVEMGAGTHIEYRIRWRKLPVRWLTEIRTWEPPNRFVDVQLQGPYRLWEHVHSFQTLNEGTLMTDIVRYALPFGPLGVLAHSWFVRADLKRIFDFRATKVALLLGKSKSHA